MEGLQHILLAFDGSKQSIVALETAKYLTKISNAKLTVAFVHDPSTELNGRTLEKDTNTNLHYTSTHIGIPVSSQIAHNNDLQERNLDQIIDKAKYHLSSVNANYRVLVGKPAEELIDYADGKNVDLIIVGNRGINKVKQFVMGSVSKKVLDQANCPVMVVK
ncbi:universal stress protein [Ornithinibacillus halotolerans]|uniref:Universal stress protein n=1 Tax=Ornithinibacillus halotolerans TaxID=1274357 RepID=A0A916WCV0_9BACI|nr:universal stress protein [Ornithinibacillus halotolerans]GGA86707.1 universal stress protein [Ornithinibacillus halotolerans]